MIFQDGTPFYLSKRGKSIPPGQYLRLRRAELYMNQQQFAKRLGVSVYALRTWEQRQTQLPVNAIVALLVDDSTFHYTGTHFCTSSTRIPFHYGLRALRHSLLLTRDQLARELGVATITLALWERGHHKPNAFNEYKIAQLAEKTC